MRYGIGLYDNRLSIEIEGVLGFDEYSWPAAFRDGWKCIVPILHPRNCSKPLQDIFVRDNCCTDGMNPGIPVCMVPMPVRIHDVLKWRRADIVEHLFKSGTRDRDPCVDQKPAVRSRQYGYIPARSRNKGDIASQWLRDNLRDSRLGINFNHRADRIPKSRSAQ